MAEVAIRLSEDDMARLKTHARLTETSPEAAATAAVMDFLDMADPQSGFSEDAAFHTFVQEGIDSADRCELEDWDFVKADVRRHMAERLAASAK